jgi:quercetin dioxygenase-like cupin family protein
MRIVRLQSDQARAPKNPEYFSGTVRQQHLNSTTEPGGIDLVAVFFEPGARTRPHIHATDQALHVVEGEGVVATEQERRLIRTGDIVIIRAGQWHWHGATSTSAMCHLSARPVGPTDWSVPLQDWETYMQGVRG